MPAIDPILASSHGPVRTCVGCRTRRPSAELVRLTRRAPDDGARPTGHVVDGASRGRGAWLCRDRIDDCLHRAFRQRGFERAWRTSLDDADRQDITRAIAEVRCTLTRSAAVTDTADETPGDIDVAAVGMTTGKG